MSRPLRACASSAVAAPPDAVFAFLSDLRNHWRLTSSNVRIVALDEAGGDSGGGCIAFHGPLGISRILQTRITQAVPPADGVGGVVEGTAETTTGTSLRVAWNLARVRPGTRVALELAVERAAPLDRLLLLAGGRRWLEQRLLLRAVRDLEQELTAQRR